MIALLLALAAEPPAPPAPADSAPMPCDLGIEALKAALAFAPGVRHAPYPRPNAFDTYYDDARKTIYFETTRGQPADPAIVKVVVSTQNGATVITPSVCAYGDQSQIPQLFDTIKTLMDPKAGSAPAAPPAANAPPPRL